MQDLFIEFLPPWVETGLQPAFYDRESGTVLQQTARMYAKVNELVKAVNGMDKVIKEYVDYIDNYFKNLDVQEEINNKLDDMAEGGELAEFIALYANLPCVHAYATISDMASSENLADGSYARAMSKTVAGTGDGAYYKIRETVEGDDPDGENLVAITGTTLVAEIIPDKSVEDILNTIGTMDTAIDAIEGDIDDLQAVNLKTNNLISNNDGMFIGTFFDNDSTTLRITASKDGMNFTRIIPSYAPTIRDPQLSYIDGKFYIINTASGHTEYDGKLLVSEDLVHWTEKTFSMGITQYDQKWAPEIFVDDDDKVYFLVTAGTVSAKKVYIAECTDLDDLTFSNLHQLYPSGMDTVSIDGNLCKKGDTYYLAWCEQGTATDGSSTSVCKIASSTDLNNWTTINSDVFNEVPFVEGIQIVPMNDRFLIYGDATTSYHYYLMKECFALNNTNGYYGMIHAPASLMKMRHGSVTYINNINALNVIAEATEGENIKLNNNILTSWPTGVNLSGTITNLVIQPNVAYQITDDTTITNLYNPFRMDKVGFAFATANGKTLTITNIESAEGTLATRNRSLTNSSDINEKVCNLSLLGNCYWYK